MPQPDVCIIGGGPAGLAAAISLRFAGASVLLLEASRPPIDKTCGEGLMPNSLAALEEIGVRLGTADGHPFNGVRFAQDSTKAEANFRNAYGLGVRRTRLHRLLADRAAAVGVDLRWNVKGVWTASGSVSLGPRTLRPSLIVGADGINSHVRRTHNFPEKSVHTRYGFRRDFAVAPWSPYIEIYCGPGRQIYVTPISTKEVGVALLTPNPHERIEDVLPLFPELQFLKNAAMSPERGAMTSLRCLKCVTKPGLALIGDASGSVDAITGEGIGLAVEQAIALGEAFRSGDLEIYERAHGRIGLRARVLARMLLALARNASAQTAAIQMAARCPALLDAILAAYVRRRPSMKVVAETGSARISLPNPERLNSQS